MVFKLQTNDLQILVTRYQPTPVDSSLAISSSRSQLVTYIMMFTYNVGINIIGINYLEGEGVVILHGLICNE